MDEKSGLLDIPVISIVLGSYNRHRFLKQTIKSIRNNGIAVPYEIIVIDGGSTDDSMAWLIKQKDIITIIQHNHGMWKGAQIERRSWGYFMNLGFKCAKGKYVMMISDDCILHPNAVMNGYRLFEAELAKGRKIGAVAYYWRNFPEQEKYWVGLTLGDKMFVNHGMYLREAFEDVGWIDENNYRFYHADGDLCLKMWQKGYETIESPDSYVEHSVHISKKVRRSNPNKDDWEKYLEKWKGIFYYPEEENIGGWIEKEYIDPYHTYKTIIKTSPRIAMLYYRNKIYSKLKETIDYFRRIGA